MVSPLSRTRTTGTPVPRQSSNNEGSGPIFSDGVRTGTPSGSNENANVGRGKVLGTERVVSGQVSRDAGANANVGRGLIFRDQGPATGVAGTAPSPAPLPTPGAASFKELGSTDALADGEFRFSSDNKLYKSVAFNTFLMQMSDENRDVADTTTQTLVITGQMGFDLSKGSIDITDFPGGFQFGETQ